MFKQQNYIPLHTSIGISSRRSLHADSLEVRWMEVVKSFQWREQIGRMQVNPFSKGCPIAFAYILFANSS